MNQNQLYYTGIGSRQTPKHILTIMHHLGAHLYTQGWTLRSGGADGADKAFENGVDAANPEDISYGKEIYLPWKGFNYSTSQLHPGNIPFTEQEKALAANSHPAWHRCSPGARLMHTRNIRQILGCEAIHGPHVIPSKFVICWTDQGLPIGGTAQALRIAAVCRIPIFNLGSPRNPDELEKMIESIDEHIRVNVASHESA